MSQLNDPSGLTLSFESSGASGVDVAWMDVAEVARVSNSDFTR